MKTAHRLITIAALLGASTAALAEAHESDLQGTPAEQPLDLRLPREAASPFRGAIPETTPQRLAWCAQQDQFRPPNALILGCSDRYRNLSGRELLVYSGLSLAARTMAGLISAD